MIATTEIPEPVSEVRLPTALGTVLFVEDNPDDYALAQYHLQKLKLRNPVHRAYSTDEMMAYLRGAGIYQDRMEYPFPEVIVMDLRLPGGSGLEAQALLRSTLKFRNVPIIAISSSERTGSLKSAVDLGADSYLCKPFNGVQFCRVALDLRLRLEFELEN
jgi:CheY-like chemotaxis protein